MLLPGAIEEIVRSVDVMIAFAKVTCPACALNHSPISSIRRSHLVCCVARSSHSFIVGPDGIGLLLQGSQEYSPAFAITGADVRVAVKIATTSRGGVLDLVELHVPLCPVPLFL